MKAWGTVLCLAWIPVLCANVALAQSSPSAEPRGDEVEAVDYEDVQLIQEAAIPTAPTYFVGITPCRIADTRGNGFGGQYGPPVLSNGIPRDIVLTGRCGIPSNAQAVSTNLTAVLPSGTGNLRVFSKGGTVPQVSTVNFREGQNIANAALVPLGDDGAITVVSSFADTDFVIDVNGYFVAPSTSQKLCTSINRAGDGWRETIPVPATWTASQCNAYRLQTVPSDSNYQLGCLRETGISLGALDGGLPSPNCGW